MHDLWNFKCEIIMKTITKIIPFVGAIALNIFAEGGMFQVEMLKPYATAIATILLLNLIVAIFLKVNDYFTYGISGVVLAGTVSMFLIPSIGQIYLENVIVGLYLGLFVVAFFPPLFTGKPFTFQFSEKNYPKAIVESKQFLKINLIINYLWAALFVVAMVLTKVEYSENTGIQMILAIAIPIAAQLIFGLPATIKLPAILMQSTQSEQIHFESVKDLFEAMPLGLNKEAAKGVDELIQFYLTGDEQVTGYLTIQNQKCTFTIGTHSNPKTTIKANSKLWLAISNNEVSGDKAFLNKEYEAFGDLDILLRLNSLFSSSDDDETVEEKNSEIKFEYKEFEPGRIKNIVVFDGGPRNDKYSKTTFITKHFCKGAKDAGANIEYIKLKEKKINHCDGCYSCWTKTPGECIHKDDMTELRKKYREADLVVFASPLYIFNVTGIFKNFMDRLLPVLKPYMLISKQGHTMHPDRYPELGEQGFVVFSAAGFPDVQHNFDGLTGMFRMWDSHNENMYMMGEFYLTAAEIIAQPVYRKRKEKIAETCYNAGKQVVSEGKIDRQFMKTVTNPGSSKKVFQSQADNFWESLESKKTFFSGMPKLKYEVEM
jgi:multimeric flavodoxin WrbA/putative sterol carrier protein